MDDDSKLLTAYADEASEDAFAELVQRHGGLVQGVARRIAGEWHADEVTQAVFLLLARKAKSLQRQQSLAGWLYKTARFVALEAVRRQRRDLKLHEQISSMQTDTPQNDSSWKQLAPVLDSALHRLRESDRQAVFFDSCKAAPSPKSP